MKIKKLTPVLVFGVLVLVVAAFFSRDRLLYSSVASGSFEKTKLWLILKANPNRHLYQEGVDEFTPFLLAINNGETLMAKEMLKHGADLYSKTKNGLSVLMLAAWSGNANLTAFLLEQGLDPNETVLENGASPLYFASAKPNNIAVIDTFLKFGGDINAKTKYGKTPLHSAASQGAIKNIEFLVKNGANINSATLEGHLPIDVARRNEKVDAVNLLCALGSKKCNW